MTDNNDKVQQKLYISPAARRLLAVHAAMRNKTLSSVVEALIIRHLGPGAVEDDQR